MIVAEMTAETVMGDKVLPVETKTAAAVVARTARTVPKRTTKREARMLSKEI